MSLNQLILNKVKPWLNIRVNDVVVDTTISTGYGATTHNNGSLAYAAHSIVGAGSTNTVSLNYVYQKVNTSGGTASIVLPAGTTGQVLIISLNVAGNDCTIPAAQLAGSLTYTLSNVGESVSLIYNADAGWSVTGFTSGMNIA